MQRRLVGVLGGMGPLATVDFMRKVIEATPAACDQDHVPMVVYCVPQIPDRVSAIAEGRDDPFTALLPGLKFLEQAGAEVIVMPCNTAHAWFDRLAAATNVPLLHIAVAVRETLDRSTRGRASVALMATRATIQSGIFQRALTTPDRALFAPDDAIQARIGAAIAAVKMGDIAAAGSSLTAAGNAVLAQGADCLLLACTELPIAMAASPLQDRAIDATQCLAEATVRFSTGTACRGDDDASTG